MTGKSNMYYYVGIMLYGGGYEGEIKTVLMVINTVPQVICLVTCL
jgi:hypothetical protein